MPLWGKIELLCRAISEEGESEAEKILSEARAEAERWVAEAEAQAQREFERELLSLKGGAHAEAKRLVDAAELEARKRIIASRERIMQEILDALTIRMQDARQEPAYTGFVLSSIEEGLENLPGKTFLVEMNPEDLERFRVAIEALASQRAVTIDLNASPSIQAGVRITTGDRRLRLDNTFEARLKQQEDSIRQEIWNRIVGVDPAS